MRVIILLQYSCNQMAEQVEQYLHVLKEWKQVDLSKKITDVLQRIQKINFQLPSQILIKTQQSLVAFHKQINKADQQKIQQKWFKQVIEAKKCVRKAIQENKTKVKPSVPALKLFRSDSNIDFPEELSEGITTQDEIILHCLYKNFIINLPETILEKNSQISAFIRKLLFSLYDLFGIDKDKQYAKDFPQMVQRLGKIQEKFSNKKTSQAKIQMIEGIIDPKGVAKLEEGSFISQKAKKRQRQRMQQIQKQNETGFYDQMKRNINKDACDQCRFCHKNAAYCEGQKQTRSADEPMTRFMKCNNCNKRWRQE